MPKKPWKIIPCPLLETILNNHAQHHRVLQPLFLHGHRGVGKTSLILNRLLADWNKGPHVTGYVDFTSKSPSPWTSWSNSNPSNLTKLRSQLETCLDHMVKKGIYLGAIGSQQIFTTLNKWHCINTALCCVINTHSKTNTTTTLTARDNINKVVPTSALWTRAVYAISLRSKTEEIDKISGLNEKGKVVTLEEKSYFEKHCWRLRLAKEVIEVHNKWRGKAGKELNQTSGFSRSLGNSATDWAYLLLELLSVAAKVDYYMPKLVINNIDILWNAILMDDSPVNAVLENNSVGCE